jgi:tetratricopeptide (TPR) repeat protein
LLAEVSQSDFVSRGQALVAAGQFQEAVKVCRLGLLGRPTTVDGRVVLGQALLALKRYDEVLAEMRVALELDQSAVPALLLKGEALLRKGDVAPAIEVLHTARQLTPADPRIMQLLGEAEHGPAPRVSGTHPSVDFLGEGATVAYPGKTGDESSGPEGYTKPTSMSSPGSARRSSKKRVVADPVRPPVAELSGTVEVDPDLEGVEVEDEIDFDDLAAPPRPGRAGGPRGAVISARGAGGPDGERGTAIGKKPTKQAVPATMPFQGDDDDDDDIALAETRSPEGRTMRAPGAAPVPGARPPGAAPVPGARPPGAAPVPGARPPGATAVRNAVAMPSGVIGEAPLPDRGPYSEAPSFAARGKGKSVPPPRSTPLSQQPAPLPQPLSAMTVRGPGAAGGPVAPPPGAPRAPIAAALPTMTAASPPPPSPHAPPAPYGVPSAKPNLPTMAIAPPPPYQQEPLFGEGVGAPSWASATMMPPQQHVDPRSVRAANEPTARPSELDPQILALMSGQPEPNPAVALDHVGLTPQQKAPKTGMRKTRSPLQVALWMLIGIVVIGGGVFAGFKIRNLRLEKQIVAARQRATDLAKDDMWKGWLDARDSLAEIVRASPTLGYRAALARTRALIAFEFGDGIADAKSEVDGLAGQGGLDGHLAAAYLALAMSDAKAAKTAADAALAASPDDPAAHYVAGNAALLAGDPKGAVTHMKTAFDKQPRPLYGVGLARAHAAAYSYEDAIAAVDKVLAGTADHPSAVIVRATVLAATGRIFPGSALANDVRAQLDRVVTQGKRPINEQKDGVSPAQVAFGHVALAQINFMRNDAKAAKSDLRLALGVNLDDQRFAEEMLDTLIALGELATARSAADKALKDYPGSRRARISFARVMLGQGRAADAIDIIGKQADVLQLPDALALRGQAYLASGDITNAKADFDAVLKRVPLHEPATIGRAWLEIATGEVDAATKRVAQRYSDKGSSAALTVVYAATLRRDPAQRETAKGILERLVQNGGGFELARAQLELARIYRDLGDYRNARPAYAAAASAGSLEARLEYGLLLIEDRDPIGGREMLDSLLRDAGERPPPLLVIEGARARLLVGDHANAEKLIELADKMSAVERWKLDRERGRLALRRSQFPQAVAALSRALDGCGNDGETFLLAAYVAVFDKPLADKVRKLAPERLKTRPEAKIVEGMLFVATEKYAEADQAYRDAKTALKAEKASPRRVAQADFGLGLVAYNQEAFTEALRTFELVMDQDPSLVDTYVFAAAIAKDQRRAFEFAQKAVQYNPDYPTAWLLVGKIASRLPGERKTLLNAINRLTQIAPTSDELKELRRLR